MNKLFYDHLLEFEEITAFFENQRFTVEEKEEFLGLIRETIDHRLLVMILDYLPPEHHENFLTGLENKPDSEELLALLRKSIKSDIESAIRKQARQLKKEILLEIKKCR